MLPIVFHSVETYQCFFFVCLFGCFFFLLLFFFVFLFLLKSDVVTWVETAKYFVNWTHVHFLLDEILYRFVWNERFGPGSYCKCCRGIEKYPENGFFFLPWQFGIVASYRCLVTQRLLSHTRSLCVTWANSGLRAASQNWHLCMSDVFELLCLCNLKTTRNDKIAD